MRAFLEKHLGRALLGGLWATALYAVVLHAFELLGYPLAFFGFPAFCYDYWSVFPGAVFLSLLVLRFSGGSRKRGMLIGASIAPLNAPCAVLLLIVTWELEACLGLTAPWKYGFEGLWGEWLRQFGGMVLLGAPVAVTCGVLMGAWLVRSES
jgi:hypothetical protein